MSRTRGRLWRVITLYVGLLVGVVDVPPARSSPAGGDIDPDVLFQEPAIQQVTMGPSGDLVVAVVQAEGRRSVVGQRRGDPNTYPLHTTDGRIGPLRWTGSRSVYFPLEGKTNGHDRTGTFLLLHVGGSSLSGLQVWIRRPGRLVSGLPDMDDVVLWGDHSETGSSVYRATIDALARPGRLDRMAEDDPGTVQLIARVDAEVIDWVTDANGDVRAYRSIVSSEDGLGLRIAYRRDDTSAWEVVWRSGADPDEIVEPISVTPDGTRLLVIAYAGGDTLGLHEFDPMSKSFGRQVFVRPGVDVLGVLLDAWSADVIAAIYAGEGGPQFSYLGEYARKHLSGLSPRAPGESLAVTGASRDHRFFTLVSMSPRNPGTFYSYAKDSKMWVRLGDVLSGIRPEQMAPCHTIAAISRDGTRVEGFLTMPETGARPKPLLVLPHGGPIGEADGVEFDPFAQYLALAGFAVLQVNYRGSAGYGREFLEAGVGQWGRGIEEDIEAVVQAVVARGDVDPDRMCIAGGSYGGYSALMGAVLRPDRYRCVATINGVTDIPLMFQSSDWSGSAWARRVMEENVGGDPDAQYDELAALSPVYRVAELNVPVLIAHGTRDVRVDPEHAHRLRLMLEAHGKPYEWLVVEGGEHVPSQAEWVRYASTLRSFLEKHLGPPEAPSRGP